MVKYLLNHRIAVIMTFLAMVILGAVTYFSLPVSLLPDIAIPHISVHVASENISARELENTVVTPLRRQLMQTAGLSEIKSDTRNGAAVISLFMNYGVDTDLAFIEVNEKIDAAMNSLPKNINRPRAVKASATDIPVVYIQMTSKNGEAEDNFIEMAAIAENIVRRRLEQLPEIAMVDITGVPGNVVRVVPDMDKLAQTGISINELEQAVMAANVEPGSMTVREGYYEYNIRVSNLLRNVQDVASLQFAHGGRLFSVGELAEVKLVPQAPDGYSTHAGRRAVTLAVIKHADENMADMNEALTDAVEYFAERYPDIDFSLTRSQTELLDFTISNLEQNLLLGLVLVFLVCILFIGSVRTSFIVGLSVIVGVIITFLIFFLCDVSINIVSMAGLILAVGMMIDNSVIVTENITQFRQRGESLMPACAKGTTEMITPMLSSSLTTVAVFVPLVFMSGIAGAIFADQAFAITAGLAASYIVGITLLPVLYFLLTRKKGNDTSAQSQSAFSQRCLALYDRGIDFCFRHRRIMIICTALTVPLCVLLFALMPQERMPEIPTSECVMRIDWNENVSLDENLRRTALLTDSAMTISSAYIGVQDYMLNSGSSLSSIEAELYFKARSASDIAPIKDRLSHRVRELYPNASFTFSKSENVFEKIFSSTEPPLQARINAKDGNGTALTDSLMSLHDAIARSAGVPVSEIAMSSQINIIVDRELLALYGVDYSEVTQTLLTAFKGRKVTTLRSFNEYTPIDVAVPKQTVEEVISSSFVRARTDGDGTPTLIPLRSLVRLEPGRDLRTLTSGADGEYLAINFEQAPDPDLIMQRVREEVEKTRDFDVNFTGSIFSNAKMMKELAVILLVSLLLMYFILCAQFESFLQPLIVLLEIPVDTAFALLSLLAFGQTLNLMSAIGIIVTCGIVVNDSILKLDSINELRKEGMPLMEAIHTAGRRRLRAIVMTSLTTVFAMVPVLFTSDMGSMLQRPMAIAMIGSMVVGTIVSIFIIPLFYWLIYRKHEDC